MTATDVRLFRDLFIAGLDRFGPRPAIVTGDTTWTYRQIIDDANRLAQCLHEMGVGPGDPVALAMSNRIEWIVADQAIIRVGAAKVAMNTMLSGAEVEHILNDSGAKVALVDGTLIEKVAEADAPELSTLICVDSMSTDNSRAVDWIEAITRIPEGVDAPQVSVKPDDVTMILYTGGTTGRPKGVVHTQRSLAWCAIAHIVEIGLQDDERMLIISPLPHATGFMAQAGMLKGATLYIEAGFDAKRVLDRLAGDQITFVFMVPTMIYRVLDRVAETQRDVSSLRTLLYGAAPMALDKLVAGLQVFGPVFMQLYGQSEAPDFITRLSREDHDPALPERLSSCGQASTFMEMAVVDADSHPLAAGEVGQVVARGPFVMQGYHNMSQKTAETLHNGWLYTGDIGRIDENGYLFLLDRVNDMIITGGMNVYSAEVESIVQTVKGVEHVAVVGVPDDDWGERVVAFVVSAKGLAPEAEAIRVTCRKHLAAYKCPKEIRFVNELPVTAYGKVDKKSLRHHRVGVTA